MRTILPVLLCGLLPWTALHAQDAATEAGATPATVDLPPALDRVLRDYERAWGDRDPEALARLFSSDGFVLRSGYPPVRGRDAIEEAYRDAGGALHLRALAYEQSGSIAYIVGGYAAAPGLPDGGKFVLTLRRADDDRWLITADMDNRNR